jgi:hypothetical protein
VDGVLALTTAASSENAPNANGRAASGGAGVATRPARAAATRDLTKLTRAGVRIASTIVAYRDQRAQLLMSLSFWVKL